MSWPYLSYSSFQLRLAGHAFGAVFGWKHSEIGEGGLFFFICRRLKRVWYVVVLRLPLQRWCTGCASHLFTCSLLVDTHPGSRSLARVHGVSIMCR